MEIQAKTSTNLRNGVSRVRNEGRNEVVEFGVRSYFLVEFGEAHFEEEVDGEASVKARCHHVCPFIHHAAGDFVLRGKRNDDKDKDTKYEEEKK